jgi:hypothetical protein
MENNPLQSRKGTKDRPSFLFIFVESLWQGPNVKLNAEGQQQFPLHTTGFEITHRILLALSGQVKPNKHRISVFCTNGKQSIGSRKGTKDRPSFSFFLWKAFRKAPK